MMIPMLAFLVYRRCNRIAYTLAITSEAYLYYYGMNPAILAE